MVGHPRPDEPLPGDKLDEQLENGLAFGFGEGGERSEIREDTVISTLRKRSGISPHIFLRDIEDDTSPPVNPGSPETQAAADRPNRYQIVGEIARGGVGAVLKGRDTDLGRDLAMKVLLENHAGNPAMVKRFVEEAQVGGQLQHPGIVPVYELGLQADSRPYFTMKLVQGRTLKALLDARKNLAEDRRRFLTIFEKVVETVAYAHARGVVHRDLKPSNIMVGAYGEVQVMDWGLAKVLARPFEAENTGEGSSTSTDTFIETVRTGETEPRSETGSVMGTPAFMPPEQARGQVDRIDERSDVFALGAILCVILTGRPPYTGKSASAVRALAARARLEPAHARLARSDADPELIRMARTCLSPAPAARPRDAGQLAVIVSAYLAAAEERARTAELDAAEARGKAAQERKARRLTVALAASMLLAVLLGGGGYLWVEGNRQARVEEKTRRVTGVLAEANLLRDQARATPLEDPAPWLKAIEAAKRIEVLAREGEIEQATMTRAMAFMTELKQEEAKARQAAQKAKHDRDFVDRLETIRLGFADDWDYRALSTEFADAFRAHGIDLDTLDADEAARRVRATGHAVPVASALAAWARTLQYLKSKSWRKLFSIADKVDPDPVREQIRKAYVSRDVEKLRSMTASVDITSLSPASIHLYANGLRWWGALDDAVAFLERAQQHFPGDYFICHSLANVLVSLKPPRRDEALRFSRAALALRPSSATALINHAAHLLNHGDLDKGLLYLERARKLQPDDYLVHCNLGGLLYKKGKLDEAIGSFRHAIHLKPRRHEAHYGLAQVYQDKENWDLAIAEIRTVLRVKPDHAVAHSDLAFFLAHKREFQAGQAALDRAIELDPDSAVVHFNRGQFYWGKQDLDRAVEGFQRSIEIEPGPEAYSNLAGVYRDKRDFDRALHAIEQAIQLEPRSAVPVLSLGLIHEEMGNMEKAEAAYQKAIQLDPDNSKAFLYLGGLLRKNGDHAGASDALKAALEKNATSYSAFFQLGVLLSSQGKLPDAKKAYENAIRIKPDYHQALENLGYILFQLGDLKQARETIEKALEIRPDSTNGLNSLGVLRMEAGDLDGAITAFEKAIQIDKDFAVAHLSLCAALWKKGDLDKADAESTAVSTKWPDNADAHLIRGAILKKMKKLDLAMASFQKALQIQPDLVQAHYNMGLVHKDQGNHEKALAAFRDAVRINPEHAGAHYKIGSILEDKNDLSGARDFLEKSVRLDPTHADAHNDLGRVYFLMGDRAKAAFWYRKAIRIQPDHVAAQGNLAALYFLEGKIDQAITLWENVIRVAPDNARAHASLGGAHFKKGRYSKAIRHLQRATKLGPDNAMAVHLFELLGRAREKTGDLDGAVSAFKEAIRLDPRHAKAHAGLIQVLYFKKRDVDGAVAACHEALECNPDNHAVLGTLGSILCDVKKDYDGAIATFQRAIAIDPNNPITYANLGNAYSGKGELDRAINAYRRSLQLDPDNARVLAYLGGALWEVGDFEESRSVLERSIRIQPRLFFAHYLLGRTHRSLGNIESTIAANENAIRLQPNFSLAHYELGVSLCYQGDYSAGLQSFRKALALHTRGATPDARSDDFKDAICKKIRDYERLIELENEIPDILQGKRNATDPRDRLLLARHCYANKRYATSARFWESISENTGSKLEDYDFLYSAACAAALASSGQGTDANTLDEAERSRLRKQAIDWLRDNLRNQRKALRETNLKKLYESLRYLKYFKCDRDLAGIRDEAALARLPMDEQTRCRTFWKEFDKLLSGIRKRIASLTK